MVATGKYTHIWHKYRPAILNLMVAADNGPKTYQLSDHEFRDLNKSTATYAFTLRVHKGRKINNIKKSTPADDLINMLKTSEKAQELSEDNVYEFELDKQFVLHIKKEDKEE